MKKDIKFILGSSSLGRRRVLEERGIHFEIVSSDIDEKSIRHSDPKKLVLSLAHAKAKALLPKIQKDAVLITGDQVMIFNNEIREKPKDKKEAFEFLDSYDEEHPIFSVGSLVVTDVVTGKSVEGIQEAKIVFKKIPKNVIESHISSGKAMKGAGGFMIEDPELQLYIKEILGGRDSVMGLSFSLLEKLIEEIRKK